MVKFIHTALQHQREDQRARFTKSQIPVLHINTCAQRALQPASIHWAFFSCQLKRCKWSGTSHIEGVGFKDEVIKKLEPETKPKRCSFDSWTSTLFTQLCLSREGICYLTSLVLKSPKHTSLNIKTEKKKKKKKRFVLDCKPPFRVVIRSIKLTFFFPPFFSSVDLFLSSLWLLNGSVLTIILALLGPFWIQ